jgi:hypothetical protein
LHHRDSSDHKRTGSLAKFKGCLLVWPTTRETRRFHVRLVQPEACNPTQHAEIFNAAVSSLFASEHSRITSSTNMSAAPPQQQRADLLTLPEAFLLTRDLLETLRYLTGLSLVDFGCIHVGLRASESRHEHLFSVDQLRDFVLELQTLQLIASDLTPFADWLGQQTEGDYFNIGCLFTWDADGNLRLCLHPKMIRSKYESSPIPNRHMKEGNLLTLITLLPAHRALASVTLQPLLCSDALGLTTDSANSRPLDAVNHAADCFPAVPPDHIDIVSVGTHTHREERPSAFGGRPIWHKDYLDSFLRAANDDTLGRHRHAIFVLSNFATLDDGAKGGLSGAFLPCSLRKTDWPAFVSLSAYGKPKPDSPYPNEWYFPTDDTQPPQPWSSRGYLAYLKPPGSSDAYMLEFTIDRLLRDVSRWRSPEGLVVCQLHDTDRDPDNHRLFFRLWKGS